MTRIYLIRHGETVWNAESRAQGLRDIKLSEVGIKQAELLASRLKKHTIHHLFSSDLSRAFETAKIIGSHLDLPVHTISELREMSFGKWEGLTLEEIQTNYSSHFHTWRSEPHNASIPDGEKLLEVQDRGLKALKHLTETYEDNIAIVSHGTIIKTILLGLLDIDLSYFYRIKQNNTCINIVDYMPYGPVLKTLNDVAHLEESTSKNIVEG